MAESHAIRGGRAAGRVVLILAAVAATTAAAWCARGERTEALIRTQRLSLLRDDLARLAPADRQWLEARAEACRLDAAPPEAWAVVQCLYRPVAAERVGDVDGRSVAVRLQRLLASARTVAVESR